jgi:2-C-methyl-D-erythritol 4-phosphate cytidylyltransferase
MIVEGGSERCYSVLNGLLAINHCQHQEKEQSPNNIWVAVHDVARPCISYSDLDKLFTAVEHHSEGAILATPVRDTMKRSICVHSTAINSDRTTPEKPIKECINYIDHTVDREQLWHALTPQVFPLKTLLTNLQTAIDNDFEVTDEASAMEYAGIKPMIIAGRSDNLKITRPEDLALAEFYLNNI